MNVPTSYPDRRWQRVLRSMTLAVAVAGVALLVPGDGQTAGDTPTAQHQAIQNQITTHDGNQTTQHNALSQKIDDLSTSADHRGLPQAWDKTLPANNPGGACPATSSRFTCVMGNAAVRDNETGLVWEQSPLTTSHDWTSARFQCTSRTTGDRKGWRLPSVHELASLVDPANSNPALPTGHPFSNVQSAIYWSATTDAGDPTFAWDVFFDGGGVGDGNKTLTDHVWCVRGAMNADHY